MHGLVVGSALVTLVALTGDTISRAGPEPTAPAAAATVAADPPAAIAPPEGAGRQLAWLLEQLSAAKPPTSAVIARHVTPDFAPDPAIVARALELARKALGPVSLVGIEPTTNENAVDARVRDRAGELHRLEIETDPFSGSRIRRWSFRPDAPVGSNGFGGTAFDRIRGGPLVGARVEVVQGTTGHPLDPPIVCTTDFAGHCRFEAPVSSGPLAVKTTHRLFWSRLDTYSPVPADALGSDRLQFPALDRALLSLALRRVNLVPGRDKGHLAGVVESLGRAPRRVLGPIACSTVALQPSGANTFYGDVDGMPDVARTTTEPTYGLWWSFNLDPGTYEAIATVDGREYRSAPAVVVADAMTFVGIDVPLDTSDAPPLPGRCE